MKIPNKLTNCLLCGSSLVEGIGFYDFTYRCNVYKEHFSYGAPSAWADHSWVYMKFERSGIFVSIKANCFYAWLWGNKVSFNYDGDPSEVFGIESISSRSDVEAIEKVVETFILFS